MRKKTCLLAFCKVLLPLLLVASCIATPTVTEPVYIREFNEVVNDLSRSGDFKTVELKYVAKQEDDLPVVNQIEMRLKEGSNLPLTENGLNSMAKAKASIIKGAIQNIDQYTWIYVVFDNAESGNWEKASSSFLYRPSELK